MTKVRDSLGVPSSLRAASKSYDHNPTGMTNAEKKIDVKNYLREHQGQIVNLQSVNDELGYGATTAQGIVRELCKAGWVKRIERHGGRAQGRHFTYQVLDYQLPLAERTISSRKARKDKVNGEVHVSYDPEIAEKIELTKKQQELQSQLHNQERFNEQINLYLWEFLRKSVTHHTSTMEYGYETAAISRFSEFMEKKANVIKEQIEGTDKDNSDGHEVGKGDDETILW